MSINYYDDMIKLCRGILEANSVEEVIKLRNLSGLYKNEEPQKLYELERYKKKAGLVIIQLTQGENNGND